MKKPYKYVVFPVSTRFYGKAADGNRTRKIQRFYAVSRLRVAYRVAGCFRQTLWSIFSGKTPAES